MKKMRKLVSILLAVVMVLAMTVVVSADNTYSIIINGENAGHTYEAYQIMTGEYSTDESGAKVLSNLKWGNGQTNHTVGTDATDAAEDLDIDDVKSLTLSTAKTTVSNQTNGVYVIDNLVPGYYLVKDVSDLAGKDDANSDIIIKVVGENITVSPKKAKPTVDKQVKDNNDNAGTGDNNGWGETADHAIGESFEFKLIANMPKDTNLDSYSSYKLVFNDSMSSGITFEKIDSVTIIAGQEEITLTVSDYVCTAAANSSNWALTIENLVAKLDTTKLSAVDRVEVIYSAHLNENAEVDAASQESAATDNKNTVYLQYSNNPNAEGLGQTSTDTVWVFTYEMDNQKVDENNDAMAGAGFRLYSDEACETEIALVKVSDGVYRKAIGSEAGAEIISSSEEDNKGCFDIKGLDAGTYYLKETTTPAGYNTCANIKVVISSEHKETEDTTSATAKITMTKDNETESTNLITVMNKKGATLPETGGIGTTIFYVLGTVLVLGAAILLITKKRMNAEK